MLTLKLTAIGLHRVNLYDFTTDAFTDEVEIVTRNEHSSVMDIPVVLVSVLSLLPNLSPSSRQKK